MEFSEAQVRVAHDFILEAVIRRQKLGAPIPQQVRDLLYYMSVGGHENNSPTAQLMQDDDLIDSTTAAEIINCTPRHICRIASDLDGRKYGREWLFRRTIVTEYAEGREGQCRTRRSAA